MEQYLLQKINTLFLKGLSLLSFFLMLNFFSIGQSTAKWQDMSNSKNASFYQLQQDFYRYWEGKTAEKGKGYKVFGRWEAFMAPRVFPSGDINLIALAYDNYMQWNTARNNSIGIGV